MRITQAERFEKRIQDRSIKSSWLSPKGEMCRKCRSDVWNENMFRIYIHYGFRYSGWSHLCRTCAPNKKAAMEYWSDEKEKS